MIVNWNLLRRKAPRTIITVLLILFAAFMLLPFLWMLSASFKAQREVMETPIRWIPETWHWENYATVLHVGGSTKKDYHFLLAYWNSIKIAVVNTTVCMLTCSMAGYAFAKLKFKGINVLFVLYLMQMMVPNQLTLIPRFTMFTELKLVNTQWPVIVPNWVNVSAVFLMRQAFMAVPNDLRESALIDGAKEYRIWSEIMIPVVTPTLAALSTIQFLSSWNDYLDPLVFLSNWRNQTLPIALNQFVGEEATQYNLVMAACCLTVLPVFAVFLGGQKFFVKGLVAGAVKG